MVEKVVVKRVLLPHRHRYLNRYNKVDRKWFWPGQRVQVLTVNLEYDAGWEAVLLPLLVMSLFEGPKPRKVYRVL